MRTTRTRTSRRRLTVLVGVALAVAALNHATAGVMTADFKRGTTRGKTLALLPPHAELIKAKAVMTDQLIEEATALERSAVKSIVRSLTRKGYTVKTVTPDDIQTDPALGNLVSALGNRYDEEWPKVLRRAKRIRYRRYNVGDVGKELASRLGVDALLMVRIQGVYVTSGKAAMGFFFGGVTKSYARVDIANVDGESGAIESYFAGFQFFKKRQLAGNPDLIMSKAFESCLRKYPAEGQVLKVNKKEEAMLTAEFEEDEDEGVNVLGDLELLLGEDTDTDDDDEDDEGDDEDDEDDEDDKR